jgi:YD repeat protein
VNLQTARIKTMNPKLYIYSHFNHLNPRTAIARVQKQFIQIAFAVHLSAVISAERYRSDSGALKRAMLTLVYFYIIMIVHKCRQSAAQSSSYQGHTVIMTGVVDVTNKIISTVQGHIVGVPTKENYKIGTPMYGADPQYRRFRFDKLFR